MSNNSSFLLGVGFEVFKLFIKDMISTFYLSELIHWSKLAHCCLINNPALNSWHLDHTVGMSANAKKGQTVEKGKEKEEGKKETAPGSGETFNFCY